MMNPDNPGPGVHAPGARTESSTPGDAEARLRMNRDILRQRLAADTHGPLASLVGLAQMAAPLARDVVRQHPYASLSGAALAGVWLVRRKPWQALGGSLLVGMLARQAIALSLSSGGQFINRLAVAAAQRKTSRAP